MAKTPATEVPVMEFRLRLSWYGSFWNTGGTWFLSTVTRRTPVLLDREGTPRSKARRGTWDTKWQTGQFPVQCRTVEGLMWLPRAAFLLWVKERKHNVCLSFVGNIGVNIGVSHNVYIIIPAVQHTYQQRQQKMSEPADHGTTHCTLTTEAEK